jgi:hypothetical protein
MRRLREIDPEPPFGRSGGHVEIVDFGETDLARPNGKSVVRRRSLSFQERRLLAGGLAVALLGASLWAWSQPHASAASTSPAPIAAVQTSATDTATPLPSASQATPALLAPTDRLPFVKGGWVRRVDLAMGSGMPSATTDPFGTLYVSGAAPLTLSGTERAGWLQTPAGDYVQPMLFSPSGQIYGLRTFPDGSAEVWGFRPDGSALYELGLSSGVPVKMALAPGGIDILVSGGNGWDWGMPDRVLAVDDRGRKVADWDVGGSVVAGGSGSQFFVRSDGTIVVGIQRQDGCATRFLDQTGSDIAPSSSCWDDLTQAPDGSILARRCDRFTEGRGAAYATYCAETTLAILDEGGRPAAGWPRRISGDPAAPAFDGGGRAYFVVNDMDAGESAITAFDPDGTTPLGWPTRLGSIDLILDWEPPIVATDRVLAWSGSSLYAFGLDGSMLAGSPFDVTGTFEWPGVYAPGFAGPGAIYLNSGAGVRAVFLDGRVAGTYTDGAADLIAWLGCLPVDGGAIALSYHAGNNRAYVLAAFLPADGF